MTSLRQPSRYSVASSSNGKVQWEQDFTPSIGQRSFAQVASEVDSVKLGRLEHRVEDGGDLRPSSRSRPIVIFAPDDWATDSALSGIVVERDACLQFEPMATFPDDADGDALRRVAERSDMSKPMDIDFAVDVPDQARGEAMAQLASRRGYATTVERDASGPRWELDELSEPLGGRSDGWGTFGN
jgi:hypothetical protein